MIYLSKNKQTTNKPGTEQKVTRLRSDIQSTVRERRTQARPIAESQEHSVTAYPGERHVSARLISLKVTQFIIPLVQLTKTDDQLGRLFWIADCKQMTFSFN